MSCPSQRTPETSGLLPSGPAAPTRDVKPTSRLRRDDEGFDPRVAVPGVEEVACQTLEQRPVQLEPGQEVFSIHGSMIRRRGDRRPKHVTANALTTLLHRETDAERIDLAGFVDVGQRHSVRSMIASEHSICGPQGVGKKSTAFGRLQPASASRADFFLSPAIPATSAQITSDEAKMTKSTGVGRGVGGGGPQPGAGRPRKAAVDVLVDEVACAATVEAVPEEQPRLPRRRSIRSAKPLLPKAYATLESVMDSSPSPSARVAAAKAVIELAKAEALDAEIFTAPRRPRAPAGDWDGILDGES